MCARLEFSSAAIHSPASQIEAKLQRSDIFLRDERLSRSRSEESVAVLPRAVAMVRVCYQAAVKRSDPLMQIFAFVEYIERVRHVQRGSSRADVNIGDAACGRLQRRDERSLRSVCVHATDRHPAIAIRARLDGRDRRGRPPAWPLQTMATPPQRDHYVVLAFAFRRSAQYRFIRWETALRAAVDIRRVRFTAWFTL